MFHLELILAYLELSYLLDYTCVIIDLGGVHLLLLGKLRIVLLGRGIVGLLELGVLYLHLPDLLHVIGLPFFEGAVLGLKVLKLGA